MTYILYLGSTIIMLLMIGLTGHAEILNQDMTSVMTALAILSGAEAIRLELR